MNPDRDQNRQVRDDEESACGERNPQREHRCVDVPIRMRGEELRSGRVHRSLVDVVCEVRKGDADRREPPAVFEKEIANSSAIRDDTRYQDLSLPSRKCSTSDSFPSRFIDTKDHVIIVRKRSLCMGRVIFE